MQTGSRDRILWGGVVLLLLVVISGGSYASYMRMVRADKADKLKKVDAVWDVPGSPKAMGALNLMVMGIDESKGASVSDAVMIIRANPKDRTLKILSIPRSTRVHIPGRNRWGKVSDAYTLGGIRLAERAVGELLGLPISRYAVLDVHGFERVVDKLGGVYMDVEKPLRYTDMAGGFHIDLRQGYQHLNGTKAMEYVRYRNDAMGDIGRVGRHEAFLRALLDQALKPKVIVKMPAVIRQVWKFLDTDLAVGDMLALAKAFRRYEPASSVSWILPGRTENIAGTDYWLPDEAAMTDSVSQFKRGKTEFSCTVDILNGCGIIGAAQTLADRLSEEGFTIGKVDNYSDGGIVATRIVDLKGSPDAVDKLYEVLNPASTEYVMDLGGKKQDLPYRSKASIVIIVGKDTQLR